MSATTTNYGLVKPELTDVADITAMNGNWDKIDAELKNRAMLDETGKVPSSQLPSAGDKVSKSGDTLTGSLTFNNNNAYHALMKYRTVNGKTYGVNVGCGMLGGEGIVSLEVRHGDATDSPLLGRLEISSRGVSFQDANEKRTYLYNSGLTAASIES